jgi:cytochrome c biogenesis protein CcdA
MYLAPILLIVGLILLNVIKLDFLGKSNLTDRWSEKIKDKGQWASLLLGIIFALAFCPYSGALYFGMLIPMTIASHDGLYLPLIFAFGTGLPVMLFSFLLAYSAAKVGSAFNAVKKVELVMRYLAGFAFILSGIYYLLIFSNSI